MPVFHCTEHEKDPVTLTIPYSEIPDTLSVDCPVCGGSLVRVCTCGENGACHICGGQ